MTKLAQLPREKLENRRRSERFTIDQTTSVTLSTANRRYRCRLEDISYGGLRVRFDHEVPEFERVVLEHRLVGKLFGRAAWQGGSAMGIEFQVAESEIENFLQCIGLMVSPDDGPSKE